MKSLRFVFQMIYMQFDFYKWALGGTKQSSLRSIKDWVKASLNSCVEVEGQECLDSMPNLIISLPGKSTIIEKSMRGWGCQQNMKILTTDTIAIRFRSTKPSTSSQHRNHDHKAETYPVPRNWSPGLKLLVLSFQVWLLVNNSSRNRAGISSSSSGFIIHRSPRRCRSIPLPVAAARE